MAELKQEQLLNEEVKATQDQQGSPEDNKQTDLEKRLEALEAKYLKETQGLNKRNSELEKKVKAVELEKMTEAERLESERKELESEKQTVKKERTSLMISKELVDAGLAREFAERIKGETEEEIKDDVKWLKEYLATEAQKLAEAEINKRLGGNPPKGGKAETKGTYQQMYDEAVKRKDIGAQLAIAREARSAGEVIKQ